MDHCVVVCVGPRRGEYWRTCTYVYDGVSGSQGTRTFLRLCICSRSTFDSGSGNLMGQGFGGNGQIGEEGAWVGCGGRAEENCRCRARGALSVPKSKVATSREFTREI